MKPQEFTRIITELLEKMQKEYEINVGGERKFLEFVSVLFRRIQEKDRKLSENGEETMVEEKSRKWWVRWYNKEEYGPYTLCSPWWVSGTTEDSDILVAAIKADTENEVIEIVYGAYDKEPEHIEFSFIKERGDDWEPFSSRFPQGDWMPYYWARHHYRQEI